jgi:hypothetical protein
MCSAKKGNEWSSTLFYFKWRLSVSHHPAETGPKVLGPSMDFDIRAKWLFVLAIECRLPREYRQRPTFFLQSRIRLGLFDLALQWITLGMRGRGYAKGASAGRRWAARSMLLGISSSFPPGRYFWPNLNNFNKSSSENWFKIENVNCPVWRYWK